MKEKRFNIGDTVTFKDSNECMGRGGCKGYYFDGVNQDGFRGIVKSNGRYDDAVGCYKIEVTTKSHAIYTMLESEFEEYDRGIRGITFIDDPMPSPKPKPSILPTTTNRRNNLPNINFNN